MVAVKQHLYVTIVWMTSPEVWLLLTLMSAYVASSSDLPKHLVGKSELALRKINRNQDQSQIPKISSRQSGVAPERQHSTPTLILKLGKERFQKFNPSLIRPSASDDLPILPLQYPNSRETLPKGADLDQKTLLELLGAEYDPNFMSPMRPPESLASPNGTYAYQLKKARAISEIKLVGVKIPGRPESNRIQIRSQKTRALFQKYLAAYSYCPVHYQWRDLGPRFWPRWIREGDCNDGQGSMGFLKDGSEESRGANAGTRSCSFPPGMTCKPQKSSIKTILWWHCRRKIQCKWMPIKYPVITTCKCSC